MALSGSVRSSNKFRICVSVFCNFGEKFLLGSKPILMANMNISSAAGNRRTAHEAPNERSRESRRWLIDFLRLRLHDERSKDGLHELNSTHKAEAPLRGLIEINRAFWIDRRQQPKFAVSTH